MFWNIFGTSEQKPNMDPQTPYLLEKDFKNNKKVMSTFHKHIICTSGHLKTLKTRPGVPTFLIMTIMRMISKNEKMIIMIIRRIRTNTKTYNILKMCLTFLKPMHT